MNLDRFRKSGRLNRASLGGRNTILIVFVLLLAVLLVGSTVLAQDRKPAGGEDFDSAEAVRIVNAVLATGGGTLNNGCMQDTYNAYDAGQAGKPPTSLNCTANDVDIAETVNLNITDDGCAFPGDTVTFDFVAKVVLNATARHDFGLYFATDGDPNSDGALTGDCSVTTAPYSGTYSIPNPSPPPANFTGSYDDQDSTNDDTANNAFGYCSPDSGASFPSTTDGFPQPCNEDSDCSTGQTCEQIPNPNHLTNLQDTCGDITTATSPMYVDVTSVVAVCEDNNSDGFLDLPFCTAWKEPGNANTLCLSPLAAFPGNKAKCNCNEGFNVPIPVPPDISIDKQGPATAGPGDTYSYTIIYTNDPGQPITNVVITDQLHGDLEFVSAADNRGGSCTPTTPGGFGQLVTCNVPDMNPGVSGTITITVKVRSDAWQEQDIINTACMDADGTLPASDPIDPTQVCDTVTTTTPVTVSYFEASDSGDGTRFEWATGSETGNAGFNIYVETETGRQKVNDNLILSSVVDSLNPVEYSFDGAGVKGDSFYIEDVSLRGVTRLHGPFAAGEAHGQRLNKETIDWIAIQLENETLAAERASVARAALAPVNNAVQPANLVQRVVTWTGNLINVALGRPVASVQTAAAAYPTVDLRVNQDGIYRVTYEQLLATTGANLAGANAADLALSTAGGSVPIYVAGGDTFGPGSYLEFYGQGLDTLYTDTNVYKLEVNAASAKRIAEDQTRTGRKDKTAAYYMETMAVEHNAKYGYLAPNGDPWYDRLMFTTTGLEFTRNDLLVDNYVNAAPSTLIAEMWGFTDLDNPVKHHVQLALNGQAAADAYFVGQDVMVVSEQAAAGSVQEGVNTVKFTVPNDHGGEYDMVALEMYGLTYPRAFVARNGQLDFNGAAEAFRVTELDSNDIVAYRVVGSTPTRLSSIKIGSNSGAYTATFAGSQREATYFVSTAEALAAPEMALSRAEVDITSGSADILIIAHPNFIDGLRPLVAARQTQGYTVKVVNVEDVYAQYSGGVFDAEAIRKYIHYALKNMDVQYVILGGGDTKDPRDYTGAGSISFIPSLYAKTTEDIYFAPVDPLYTDLDGNNVPDAAIGRFPVRSVNQLTWMVDKTLLYDNRTERQTAAFAADVSYEDDSDSFVPAGWSVNKAYVGPDGLATARTNLINSMNDGPALTSFVGHSDTDVWTFDPLFSTWDAAALTNYDKPMVITQWGCFNTYYVGEAYVSLGDNFLLRPNIGAAAVTGATTITNAHSERELGKILMPKLVQPGMSIGQAMQEAKVELAANRNNRGMVDVQLGWTILGDPTLVVQP